MAGTCAQSAVNTGNEAVQNIIGNECLDGTGKAAAVNTEGTPACQIMLAQRQGHSHILVGLVAGGDHILQVHVGGVAALLL